MSQEKVFNSNRILWIDTLKGITVLLVALHHSILSAYSINLELKNGMFDFMIIRMDLLLAQARMPAFFFAGGIVLASLKKNKISWYLNKRLPFMLWIIFIWTSISFSVEMLGLHLYPWTSFPFFLDGYDFLSPYGNLWFMYALVIVSGFAVIVSNASIFNKCILTIFISLMLAYFVEYYEFEYDINKILFFNICYKGLPFFMFGFVFKDYFISFVANKFNLYFTALFFFIYALFFNYMIDDFSGYYSLFFRYIPATFLFVSISISLTKTEWFRLFFSTVGKLSLEVFLLHQFFVALFFLLYTTGVISFSGVFGKSIVILSPLFFCLLFVFLFKKHIRNFLFSLPMKIRS